MEKTEMEDTWHFVDLEETRRHRTGTCDCSLTSSPRKARSPNRPRRTVTQGNRASLQGAQPSSTGSDDVGAGSGDSDRTLHWPSSTFSTLAVSVSPSTKPRPAVPTELSCHMEVQSPGSSVAARPGSVRGLSFYDNAGKALNALRRMGRKHYCKGEESPAPPVDGTSEASHLNVAVDGEVGDGLTMSEVSLAEEPGVTRSRRAGDWQEDGCCNDVPLLSHVAIRGQRASCRANETPSWCSSVAGQTWPDLPTDPVCSCRSSSYSLWQKLLQRKTCPSRYGAFVLQEDEQRDEPSKGGNSRLLCSARDSAERTASGKSHYATPQDLSHLDEQRDLPASRPADRGLSLLRGCKDNDVTLSSDDGGNGKSGAVPRLKIEISADEVQSDSDRSDRVITGDLGQDNASDLNFGELNDSAQHLFSSASQGEARRTKRQGQPNSRMSEAVGHVVCALRHLRRHLGNQLRVILFMYATCAGKPGSRSRSPEGPVRV